MSLELIEEFVTKSKGLSFKSSSSGKIYIRQTVDGKVFHFTAHDVTQVLERMDSDSQSFLQVNFKSSVKILITDSLIGFKPMPTLGLDMGKLPKVVTTPDLFSVFEAIEESLGNDVLEHEIDILKKVFYSILSGAEAVGFSLEKEKELLGRLISTHIKASA